MLIVIQRNIISAIKYNTAISGTSSSVSSSFCGSSSILFYAAHNQQTLQHTTRKHSRPQQIIRIRNFQQDEHQLAFIEFNKSCKNF